MSTATLSLMQGTQRPTIAIMARRPLANLGGSALPDFRGAKIGGHPHHMKLAVVVKPQKTGWNREITWNWLVPKHSVFFRHPHQTRFCNPPMATNQPSIERYLSKPVFLATWGITWTKCQKIVKRTKNMVKDSVKHNFYGYLGGLGRYTAVGC